MRPIVADRRACSVGLSVGLSVIVVSPTKTVNRSRCRLVWGLRLAEPCIRWGSKSPTGRGNFNGERGRSVVKYRDPMPWAV